MFRVPRSDPPPNLTGIAPRMSPHGRITAVSMMKDEGPYVLEWVAHHLAVGFTDLVVYTNDCSDGTDDMLIRLEEMGLLYHRRNVIPEGLRPQPSALNYAQEEPLVGTSDWVMVFDADEFLCIKYGDGTLDDMISAAKARGANGIVITWRIFGSGGVQDWSRAPVTEQYLMAAPPMWNKGWGVKTLFQFTPEHWKLGIHRPKLKNKWLETEFPASVRWLNGSGQPMEDYFKFRGWRSITRTIGYDWAQLNHYAVKSVDSYAIRKFRGNVNNKADKYNSDYWALQDRNEVRDDAMLRYSAARSRIFDALLTDPDLNRLHFAALARAEARLAEFKGTEAYEAMVAGLKAASAIPIDQVKAKPPQARDPEKIASLMSRVEKASAEKQKAARVPGVAELYVAGPVDQSVELALTWHPNRDVALPADPRLFTPPALALIASGKFERHLARSLPRLLPQGSTYVEIGAACGFMATLLARARPDLRLVLAEEDPGFAAALRQIRAQNGVGGEVHGAPMVRDAARLSAFLAQAAPDTLVLGDPGLAPGVLEAAEPAARPSLVVLTHRLLAARPGDIAAYEALFTRWGLTERPAMDATLAMAFGRLAG